MGKAEETKTVEVNASAEGVDKLARLLGAVDSDEKAANSRFGAKTLEELLEFEEAARDGYKHPIPYFPGAWVRVGHVSAADNKIKRLEREWRQINQLGPQDRIPDSAQEEIYIRGVFGTAVTEWHIPTESGSLPFNEDNHVRLTKQSTNYRGLILEQARSMQSAAERFQEEAEGNSATS